MTLISSICFVLFFALLISFIKRNSDVLSPGRLFLMIWTLSIGLADLKLSRFQFEWSAYSWTILLLSIFSVLLGMFVVYVINFGKPVKSLHNTRLFFADYNLNHKAMKKIILFMFAIYLVSYFTIFSIVGYVPLFTARPDEARIGWGMFGFGLIIHIVPSIIYFVVLFFLFVKSKKSNKILLVFLLVITVISFILLLQRFDLMIAIVLTGVMLYYASNKLRPRNILLMIALIGGMMYGIQSIRQSRYLFDILYYISDMKYHIKYSIFTEPYMYISMNLENFANSVNKLDSFTYGFFSFDFLLALTGLKHWIYEYFLIKDFPNIITSSFNTYTMFFAYYRDFGIIGSVLIPFLFGFVTSYLYYKLRKNPNINSISIYGIFVFVIIFSFFIPMLSWLHFVFNLSVIYFTSKYVLKFNGHPGR